MTSRTPWRRLAARGAIVCGALAVIWAIAWPALETAVPAGGTPAGSAAPRAVRAGDGGALGAGIPQGRLHRIAG